MLFTYAQLSPGGREKEGSEKVGRTMESHEEAERREGREARAKVHHAASERKRERLR